MDGKFKSTQRLSKKGLLIPAPLAIKILRGLRNGLYYGARIRFLHALVMTILYKKGKPKDLLKTIIRLTWEHARNLGIYVASYKILTHILNKVIGTQAKKNLSPKHPDKVVAGTKSLSGLIAGVICGYLVWSKNTAVNEQLMLYLLSRIVTGGTRLLAKRGYVPDVTFYPILTAVCWGIVMYLFEKDSHTLQNSLRVSMDFLYTEADTYSSWKDFLPLKLPGFVENFLSTHFGI